MNEFVLVTGGAGYIGSHTCKALSKAGYTPVVFDNLIRGNKWSVKWGPFEFGEITDQQRLEEVFNKYKPKSVIHFAAYAYVNESIKNPVIYYQNNVGGTLTLLETMKNTNVSQMVFSSTCSVYGQPEDMPIKEDHPKKPINPYGTSKLMIECILKDFEQAYGIRSISLRYFNAAGADQNLEIGERHNPETHLIPLILQATTGEKPDVTIFGTDYNTHDGTCIRDYIHVSDLADAHLLSLEALKNGMATTAFNLGNGNGFSVYEVIQKAQIVTNKAINTKIASRRTGDPAKLVANAKLAKKVLGWRPKYPDLKTMVETAWNWHKKAI